MQSDYAVVDDATKCASDRSYHVTYFTYGREDTLKASHSGGVTCIQTRGRIDSPQTTPYLIESAPLTCAVRSTLYVVGLSTEDYLPNVRSINMQSGVASQRIPTYLSAPAMLIVFANSSVYGFSQGVYAATVACVCGFPGAFVLRAIC